MGVSCGGVDINYRWDILVVMKVKISIETSKDGAEFIHDLVVREFSDMATVSKTDTVVEYELGWRYVTVYIV